MLSHLLQGQNSNRGVPAETHFSNNLTELEQREAVLCPVLDIGQQQVITHSCPDLSQHIGLAGIQKRLDLSVLSNPKVDDPERGNIRGNKPFQGGS